ncbi:hypothetical protein C1645_831582 [Glomus cerebriforme]|uniref:K Homology domain-containing protein n=1 Tax=Glomus cerebriforme TaxID=658196 RepID=A0A397SQ00_9GLOM|nr:hypothetical protein C1645_831582 [Glomus cerebriforme]
MQTQIQNPRYSTISIISTRITIPQNVEIGKLIGFRGHNLKKIGGKTNTFIYVNSDTNPAQIEISLKNFSNGSEKKITKALDKLDKLIKSLETERNQIHTGKMEEKDRILKDDNNQQATLKIQKEIDSEKKGKYFKREMSQNYVARKIIGYGTSRNLNSRRNIP